MSMNVNNSYESFNNWAQILKIGLNATCLNDRPSGARQRFVGIYSELFKQLPDSEFVIYEPIDCRVGSWFDGVTNVFVKQTPIPSEGRIQRLIGGFRYWGAELAREKFDFFEGFHLPLIKAPTGKTLVTIHDIRGVNSEYGAISRTVYKKILDKSISAADHVITVSETMKEEILRYYPDTSISVIYNGFDIHGLDGVTELAMLTVRQKLALPEEFLLAVGHFEERKNYFRLIEALSILRDRGCSCPLVIIGNDNGGRHTLEKRIESLNLSGHVKILSGLSNLEVHCAYKLCSLFIFPSTYEGFGIPILEAMAAGRPMVLSDIAVFREITQNHGIYFPYDDVQLMASAIETGLSSSVERTRLIDYGNERIKDFSFINLAAQIVSLYKS